MLAGLLAGIGLVALLIARVEVSRRLGVTVRPLDQAYSLEALRPVSLFLGLIVYFAIDTLNFALGDARHAAAASRHRPQRAAQRRHLGVERGDAQPGRRRDALGSAVRGRAAGLCLAVLLRFGLVSTAVMLLFTDLMTRLPVTLERARLVHPAVGAHAGADRRPRRVYGFVVALAGRSPFGAVVLAADREA